MENITKTNTYIAWPNNESFHENQQRFVCLSCGFFSQTPSSDSSTKKAPNRGFCFSLFGAYGLFSFTMKFYTNFTISLIVCVGDGPGAVGSDRESQKS